MANSLASIDEMNGHPMAQLLFEIEMTLQEPKTGEIRTGIIVDKRPNELLVDIGFKSEGVVSGRELERLFDERIRHSTSVIPCPSSFYEKTKMATCS
jgi:predicted SPOUT superfamily RNA methylase MTH1